MKNKAESTKQNISSGSEDVIDLILRDHKPLKTLIKTLKDTNIERVQKEGPLEDFIPLLVSHAKAEERSLYVQMKEVEDLRMESFEGDTEHAIADQLVQEINACADDDEWNAKVKVLAELVEHHIEEEEQDILKDVREKINLPKRQAIGDAYLQIKTELDALRNQRPSSPQNRVEHRLN